MELESLLEKKLNSSKNNTERERILHEVYKQLIPSREGGQANGIYKNLVDTYFPSKGFSLYLLVADEMGKHERFKRHFDRLVQEYSKGIFAPLNDLQTADPEHRMQNVAEALRNELLKRGHHKNHTLSEEAAAEYADKIASWYNLGQYSNKLAYHTDTIDQLMRKDPKKRRISAAITTYNNLLKCTSHIFLPYYAAQEARKIAIEYNLGKDYIKAAELAEYNALMGDGHRFLKADAVKKAKGVATKYSLGEELVKKAQERLNQLEKQPHFNKKFLY